MRSRAKFIRLVYIVATGTRIIVLFEKICVDVETAESANRENQRREDDSVLFCAIIPPRSPNVAADRIFLL